MVRVAEEAFPIRGEDVERRHQEDPTYRPTLDEYLLYENYMREKPTASIGELASGVADHLGNIFGKGFKGLFKQNILKTAASGIEGAVQGTADLTSMLAQPTNPDSWILRTKDAMFGAGADEERYKRHLSALDTAEVMSNLREGKDSLVFPQEALNNDVVQLAANVADASTFVPVAGWAGKGTKLAALSKASENAIRKSVGATARGAGRVMQRTTDPILAGARAAGEIAEEVTGLTPGQIRSGAGTVLGAGAFVNPVATKAAIGVASVKGANIAGEGLEAFGRAVVDEPGRLAVFRQLAADETLSNSVRNFSALAANLGGDAAIDFGIKGASGAVDGMIVGGLIGGLSEGEEGALAGGFMGGVLGGGAMSLARTFDYATGRVGVERQQADFSRWIESLDEGVREIPREYGALLEEYAPGSSAILADADAAARRMGGTFEIVDRAEFMRRNEGVDAVGAFNEDANTVMLNIDAMRETRTVGDRQVKASSVGHEVYHQLAKFVAGGSQRDFARQMIFGDAVSPGLYTPDSVRAVLEDYGRKLKGEGREAWNARVARAFEEGDGVMVDGVNSKVEAQEFLADELMALHAGFSTFAKSKFSRKPRYTNALMKGGDTALDGVARKMIGVVRKMFERRTRKQIELAHDRGFAGAFAADKGGALVKSPGLDRFIRDVFQGTADVAEGAKRFDTRFTLKGATKAQMAAMEAAGLKGAFVHDEASGKIIRPKTVGEMRAAQRATKEAVDRVISSTGRDPQSLLSPDADGVPAYDMAALRRELSEEDYATVVETLSRYLTVEQGDMVRRLSEGLNGKLKQAYRLVYWAATGKEPKRDTSVYRSLGVSEREVLPYTFKVSAEGGLYVKGIDLASVERRFKKAYKAIGGDGAGLFKSIGEARSEFTEYLKNLTDQPFDIPLENRTLSEDYVLKSGKAIGAKKRDFFYEVLGTIPSESVAPSIDRRGRIGYDPGDPKLRADKVFKSFRIDRMGKLTDTGRSLNFTEAETYKGSQANLMPEGEIRFLPDESQPENAPIQGRLTKQQQANIEEVASHYKKVSPKRVKKLRSEAIDSLSSRLINEGIPVREAKEAARQYHEKVLKHSRESYQVMSGFGDSDLSRMAGTGRPALPTRKGVNPNWLTSAFEAIDGDKELALLKTQQVAKGVNKKQLAEIAEGKVIDESKASNVRSATLEEGMTFLRREALADKKAFGSSLREDMDAPPRVYASVTEGQKFGAAGNYNVFFRWKKEAPMVITSHHHYGVGNGLTDIHRSADVGDKNARSFGDPGNETYSTLPSGKKILDTHLLVSGKYAPEIRAHQLSVSVPQSEIVNLRKSLKRGEKLSDRVNQLALRQLVGFQSQGKAASFRSSDGIPVRVAIQRNRTEAYVLNPDLKNVAEVVIASNKPDEIKRFKQNLKRAFENNGSPMPKVKVVSKDSGPSGNKGRKAITDEWEKATGEVVYLPDSAVRQTKTPQFKKWFGKSKVVDDSGVPIAPFHASTHSWTIADATKTNPENDLGQGIYFTSHADDANFNYSDEGADLTNRIDREAERIQDSDPDIDYEEARDMARESLHGGAPQVRRAFLKIENPVEIGGKETWFTFEQRVDDDGDYIGEPKGLLVKYLEKLDEVADEFDVNQSEVDAFKEEVVNIAIDYDGIGADELILRFKEHFPHVYDEWTDAYGTNEFMRRVFEEAGFDGFIDRTVFKKFGINRYRPGMQGLEPDTVHYVVWDSRQIKSATGNRGTFDASNPDIRYMPSDADYMKAVEGGDLETAQQMVDEAAKKAGYTVGKVFHGTKRKFNSFRSDRDSTKLIYFSTGRKFAEEYPRGSGGHRNPEPEIQARIDAAREASRNFVEQSLTDDLPQEAVSRIFDEEKAMQRKMLDGMTVSEAEMGMGIRVIDAYLKADKIFDPRKSWREFEKEVLDGLVDKGETLSPQMLNYIESGNYLVWERPHLIDAVFEKYDAIVLDEYGGNRTDSSLQDEPITIAVRDPNKIKSADPVTYDDAGNVIPLSERFNEASDDIRLMPDDELRMQDDKDVPDEYKSSRPGTKARMLNSGRIYSPEVAKMVSDEMQGKAIDRDKLDRVIERDIPIRPVTPPKKKSDLPSVDEIKNALTGNQAKDAHTDAAEVFNAGDKVTLRQDVPSWNRARVGVVTVRGKDGRIAYVPMVRVSSLKIEPTVREQKSAARIASGTGKVPTIKATGTIAKNQSLPNNLNEWKQVGFNPDRHSYYYIREGEDTGRPVVAAEEAVQIGNTIFVKGKIVYGERESFRFMPDGLGAKDSNNRLKHMRTRRGSMTPYVNFSPGLTAAKTFMDAERGIRTR